MNKPTSVALREFKSDLTNLVNNCGMPAIVIVPVLKEITEQVIAIEQQQYEKEKIEYEKSLKEE